MKKIILILLILVGVLISGCSNFGCVDDDQCYRDYYGKCQKSLSPPSYEPEGDYECVCEDMVCVRKNLSSQIK